MSTLPYKFLVLFFSLSTFSSLVLAHPKKQPSGHVDEVALIKSMQGCFEVTSAFGETGIIDDKYPIVSRDYFSKNYEYIALDGDGVEELELQHILLTALGPQKTQRDQWVRSPRKMISYLKPHQYKQSFYPSKGNQWLLTVRAVDESPLYSCAASFGPVPEPEEFAYWNCSHFSPVPWRESSQRNDYNFLGQNNFISFSKLGWVHKQSNRKIQYVEGEADVSKTIAWEDGYVSYKKTDDQNCKEAKAWWQAQSATWSKVREVWANSLNNSHALVFLDPSEKNSLTDEVLAAFTKAQAEIKNLGTEGSVDEVYQTMQLQMKNLIEKYVKEEVQVEED
ncbi:MAG: hypothetical protein QE271_09925 [Bacteriovoracaceae bacterium]|nr:hypothetical protein [Bacteriovoracaceae bacterium]